MKEKTQCACESSTYRLKLGFSTHDSSYTALFILKPLSVLLLFIQLTHEKLVFIFPIQQSTEKNTLYERKLLLHFSIFCTFLYSFSFILHFHS